MHIRIQRWVVWWFCLGVVAGAVAIVNILVRDLSQAQEKAVLLIGALHWLVGGLFCYGLKSLQIESYPPLRNDNRPRGLTPQSEWHPASDFLLPGNRKSLLRPRY